MEEVYNRLRVHAEQYDEKSKYKQGQNHFPVWILNAL